MKLEDFLYEYLTNFFDFNPSKELEQAIHNWVYEGIVPGDNFPRSWANGRRFEEECKRGTEYFLGSIDKK